MSHRLFPSRILPSMLFVCVCFPVAGRAQPVVGVGVGAGPWVLGPNGATLAPYGPYGYGGYGPGRFGYGPGPYGYGAGGLGYGPGSYGAFGGGFGYGGYGYGYGGYPYGFGWPGYRGATGSYWTNGLSLYGPPVPTPGPTPGVFGNSDLVNQWRATPTPGWGGGWVGVSVGFPHRRPAWALPPPAVVELLPPAVVEEGAKPPLIPAGGNVILSVKVPQPAAELFVDGVRTALRGTDRILEAPPVPVGRGPGHTVTARWLERGATVERTKVVTGTPGEVVRVDLTAP